MGYVRRKRSVEMALPVTMLNGSESGQCDVVDGRCVAGAGYQWRSSLNPANNASAAACGPWPADSISFLVEIVLRIEY